MAENPRVRKMAERIQQIIARRIERGIRDPRLGFVTITDVRVTGDLQHASVFYTVYGTDEERADSAAALKAATGMFRSEVGKNITARLTPSLEFILDALPENAAQMEDLLSRARAQDEQVSTIRVGASYAGDEDPYVKPHDFDADESTDESTQPDDEDAAPQHAAQPDADVDRA